MQKLVWALGLLLAMVATPVHATYYYIPTFYYYAPPTPSADPGSYTAIKKVAVISALGSRFTWTGRSDKLAPLDISPLAVDAQVATLLKKYLGARFEFVDMPADGAAAPQISHNFFGETKTLAYLKTLTNPGVDAYIVVRPVGGDLPGPDGLGIQASRFSNELWANFEIDIVDAHQLRVIASAAARLQTREEQEPMYAAIGIDGVTESGKTGAMSPDDLAAIGRYINQLLPAAMVETLRALKIGVTLPPVGDHGIFVPANAFDTRAVKSVAVVSAIGDSVRLVKGGHIFIKRTDVRVPTPNSGLDDQVETLARAALSPHYTIKPANIDRTVLAGVDLATTGYIPSPPGLTRASDIDAFVLFLKVGGGWNFADLQSGLGLFHWIPAGNEMTAVYAKYAVIVIDARTLKPLSGVIALPPPKKVCAELVPFMVPAPNCVVDDKYAPDPPDRLSDQTETVMRENLRTLLSATVDDTLFRAGLNTAPAK